MMTRLFGWLVFVVLAMVIAGCGLLREPEEASETIEAIPLELETPMATEEQATATAEPTSVEEPDDEEAAPDEDSDPEGYPGPADVEEDALEGAYPGPDEASGETPEAYPAPDEGDGAGAVEGQNSVTDEAEQLQATGGPRVYEISQEASQVRFELDEDLRGQRTTVVGTTNQVAGELVVNLADLSTARIGTIQINARTLLTDNRFRNRAIQNEILETDAYEFVTFAPTAIVGLPASATVGEEVAFIVEGNLTIRDVTHPASFDVTAVAVSDAELAGTATLVVEREAFGLTIPAVRNVANVEDVVELVIDFVARSA